MYLFLVMTGLLAGTFLVTATTKVVSMRSFRAGLEGYGALAVLPRPVRTLLVVLVPVAELAVVVLVLTPATTAAGYLLGAPIALAFLVLVATDERPAFSNCGCSTASPVAVPRSAYLLRNAVVTATAAVGLVLALTDDRVADVHLGARIVAVVVLLPLALVVVELPLIRHIVEVDRQRLPAKVQAARNRMSATT